MDVTSTNRRRKNAPLTKSPSSSSNGNEITNNKCPSTPSAEGGRQKSVDETPSKNYGND
jgi:hypothetical protein